MKNKKALGLLLSLALGISVVVPGTLATEADTDSSETTFSITKAVEQTSEADEASDETGKLSEEEVTSENGTNSENEATVDDKTKDETETSVPTETKKSVHIEGCSDECLGEGCTCSCHQISLFDRLMACDTLDELYAIAEDTPEDELRALTKEENAQIEKKIADLEPDPLPPVVLEESTDEPVPSEIIYPTVNFDKVAPFGDPVEG